MRLREILKMYAGGEGSGCQGPNCGRPRSGLGQLLDQVSEHFKGQAGLWQNLAKYGKEGNVGSFSGEELKDLRNIQKRSGLRSCKLGYCYQNAQTLAMAGGPNLKLMEGLASVHGVPIAHSWLEYNGKVYDPTMAVYKPGKAPDYAHKHGKGKVMPTPDYIGVEIPKDQVYRHQLKTKTYSPLTEDWDLKDVIWK